VADSSKHERHAEMLRAMKSLARIHAARAVDVVKETAWRIGSPRSWAERIQPQRRMELEFE
jgi:hypothetical protein